MSSSEIAKQLLKTFIAIWPVFHGIGLKLLFFEYFPAVCAYKAFRMEFFGHGSYYASSNSFPTNVAIIDFPVVQIEK